MIRDIDISSYQSDNLTLYQRIPMKWPLPVHSISVEVTDMSQILFIHHYEHFSETRYD